LTWKISEIESEIDDLYLRNLKVFGESVNSDARIVTANLFTIRYLERITRHRRDHRGSGEGRTNQGGENQSLGSRQNTGGDDN
jgi:hypothetical protein